MESCADVEAVWMVSIKNVNNMANNLGILAQTFTLTKLSDCFEKYKKNFRVSKIIVTLAAFLQTDKVN